MNQPNLDIGLRRAYFSFCHEKGPQFAKNGYHGIIFDILEGMRQPRTVDDIITKIQDEFLIRNPSRERVLNALVELHTQGFVSTASNGWRLTPHGRTEAANRRHLLTSHWDQAMHDFLWEYEKRRGQVKSDERHLLQALLGKCLVKVAEAYGGKICIFFATGGYPVIDMDDLLQLIDEIIKNERGEDVSAPFLEAFKSLLQDPRGRLPEVFYRLAYAHALSVALKLDPHQQAWRRDFVSRMEIYLDTNVLIALLCQNSGYHEDIRKTLQAIASLNTRVIVTAATRSELNRVIQSAKEGYERFGSADARNEFLIDYIRTKQLHGHNWESYHEQLIAKLDALFAELRIQTVETRTDPQLRQLELLVSATVADKTTLQVAHDTLMLYQVHNQRVLQEGPLGSPWYLTLDFNLDRADQAIQRALNSPKRSGIMCPHTLLELLLLFEVVELDDEFHKVFMRLAGRALAPRISALELKDFFDYVEQQFGPDQRKQLETFINRTHLTAVVSAEFHQGKPEEGLRKILEKLESPLTFEAERARLIGRIRELAKEKEELTKAYETRLKTVGDMNPLREILPMLKEVIDRTRPQENNIRIISVQEMNQSQIIQAESVQLEHRVNVHIENFFDAFERLAPTFPNEVIEWRSEEVDATPEEKVSLFQRIRRFIHDRSEDITAAETLLAHVEQILLFLGKLVSQVPPT